MRNMFSRGVKRKSGEGGAEGPLGSSYSLQRQSLLDMSLIKLQLCHMLVEPDLCRSVLIANTVRQIQEDMSLEGGGWQLRGPAPSERLVASELLCRSREPEPKLFSVISYEGCREEEVESECPCWAEPEEEGAAAQVFGTFEIKSGSPDLALEELFSDVDTSYYDLDTMLTGMQGAAKGGPYELLDPSPSTCRSDLNELDHIMEIIVGS